MSHLTSVLCRTAARRALGAATLAGSLVLATGAAPAVAAGGSAQASATYTVEMINFKFVPEAVTINRGDTVNWVNRDVAEHDVRSKGSAMFASDPFGQGGTFSFTFAEVGSYDYLCTLHSDQEGVVTVVESGAPPPAASPLGPLAGLGVPLGHRAH